MPLTSLQTVIILLAVAFGTVITRFLPFVVFGQSKKVPKPILQLGEILPPAVIGMLVVYCLKDIDFLSASHALPEMISIAVILILHRWKNNVLLSIGFGTVLYMVLIQFVF